MAYVSSGDGSASASVSRPMVMGLFAASCALSLVSWYTTQQGMALYLSPWFSVLASLGIQSSLVLVAWLIGFTKTKRGLLIAVYAITAVVSVAFSYVSLYTWFSSRERPATIERQLYDTLNTAAAKTEQVLASAVAEGRKHVMALDEMTAAEKSHGFISRAQDSDPYLGKIRDAVAKEAQSYAQQYKEGSGEGLRYTAFDRYAKLARQSLEQMQQSQQSMASFRSQLKPLDPTDQQLRRFHEAYDGIPWPEVEQTLHTARLERPTAPNYADFVDRSVSGQEDLMLAFQELFTAPTSRHIFSFALAAFIDIIVFLLAYASGPHFFGPPEHRWCMAGAAVDAADDHLFVRDFVRKLEPGPRGMPRVDVSAMSPGERQLCLLLVSKGEATMEVEEGRRYYVLSDRIHEILVESLSHGSLPLRTARRAAAEV